VVYPPESIIRLPLLKLAKDGKIHSVDDAEKQLAKFFKLSPKIRNQIKPSGGERLFLHKLRWSRTDLKIAGIIRDPKTAHFQITPRGLKVLKNPPPVLTDKFLSQYKEFANWRRKKKQAGIKKYFSKKSLPTAKTPEGIEKQYRKIEQTTSKRLKKLSKSELSALIEQFELRKEITKAKRKTARTKAFARDPKLAAAMKVKNNHRCQICEKLTFKTKDGIYFTESHHIIPRAKGGPDVPSNIVIVCPNCHKIFDKGNDDSKIKAYRKLRKNKLFSDFSILLKKHEITNSMFKKIQGAN